MEFHYTPKHGSWLNMAEIESVLARRVRRRIADEETLSGEIAALEAERNQAGATIDWRFSTVDARVKLHHLYPELSQKSDLAMGSRQVYLRSETIGGIHAATDGPRADVDVAGDEPLDHPARFVAEFVDALGRDAGRSLAWTTGRSWERQPTIPVPVECMAVRLHDRCALLPEAGGGLPGPDSVPVVDRVAASRSQYSVAVLQTGT